jgi:hypothetical protein
MSQRTEDIIETLKAKRLRVTPQRFAVYANLLDRTDHPTAEQLLTDLNQHGPVSSQATIYNSLQALQGVGLVREVLLGKGSAATTLMWPPITISAAAAVARSRIFLGSSLKALTSLKFAPALRWKDTRSPSAVSVRTAPVEPRVRRKSPDDAHPSARSLNLPDCDRRHGADLSGGGGGAA